MKPTLRSKLNHADSPRGRRRRLRSLRFAPTLFTLGNLICGFAAIHFALRAMEYTQSTGLSGSGDLPHPLLIGAGLVIVGMIFDCLDGLIARVTRSTTDFGGQLDSLADIVNFGVAPAILMLAFIAQMKELAGDALMPSPISEHFTGRAIWVSAAMYVAFTAIRLARFNVEHTKADYDYRTFHGLPSPGAAAIIVSLIIIQDIGPTAKAVVTYTLPLVTLAISFLMVSRIPYRRFSSSYLAGRRPFAQVLTAVLLVAAFGIAKAPTLLIISLAYGVSGPIEYVMRVFRRNPVRHPNQSVKPEAISEPRVASTTRSAS